MPALAPSFVDTPVGATDVPVTARDLRALTDALQPGVVGGTHLRPSASGLGVAFQPGVAYIPDGQASQTLYRCEWAGDVGTVALEAAHPALPRLDQMIARVQDMNVDGGTQRRWALEVLKGSPATGVTLANRVGALDLPPRSILIADLLVPPGALAITAANVADRRSWARGAFCALTNSVGGTRTTTSTNASPIDGNNSSITVECSGRPIRVRLHAAVGSNLDGGSIVIGLFMDGQPALSSGAGYPTVRVMDHTLTFGADLEWVVTPPAGRHTFTPIFSVVATSYTGYVYADSDYPCVVSVEELVRQNAQNT